MVNKELILIEAVDIVRVQYLLSLDNIVEDEKKNHLLKLNLNKYLKGYKKSNGFFIEYKTIDYLKGYGRIYPYNSLNQNTGLTIFPNIIRSYLAEENYIDIDIVKAHWFIIKYLFKKYNLNYKLIDDVLKNYDDIMEALVAGNYCSREDVKPTFFSLLYTSPSLKNNVKLSFVKNKFPFFKVFHNVLYSNFLSIIKEEYKPLYDIVSKKNKGDKNIRSKFLSHVLQHNERLIITDIVNYVTDKGYDIGSIIHDGFLLKKCKTNPEELFDDIYEHMKTLYPELEFKLVVKPFKTHNFKTDLDGLFNEKKKKLTYYQKLINILKKYSEEHRLKNDGETIYKPSNINPMVYEVFYTNTDKFIEKVYENTNDIINEKANGYENVLTYIKKRNEKSFNKIEYDLDWIAFRNGSLKISENKFYSIDELPLDIVARKFINQDFEHSLETPLFDSIIEKQLPDAESRKWFYILVIARLLLNPRNDSLHCFPYIYGQSSTGKSTIANIVSSLFEKQFIGYLNSNKETTFGLESYLNKQLVLGADMPEKISHIIPEDTLKKMVTGEGIEVPRKHNKSQMFEWNVPLLMISNYLPDYQDIKGAISKRIVFFMFNNQVFEQNSNLEKNIINNELPALIYKSLLYYYEYDFTTTFENIRPAYFEETTNQYIENISTLYQFLNQTDRITDNGTYSIEYAPENYIILTEFNKKYINWCKNNNLKPSKIDNSILNKFSVKLKDKKRICSKCSKLYKMNTKNKAGCCSKVEKNNYRQLTIIEGLNLIFDKTDI